MYQCATGQPLHKDYPLIGWIPTRYSTVIIQFRVARIRFGAVSKDQLFPEDFPNARSPVDFR